LNRLTFELEFIIMLITVADAPADTEMQSDDVIGRRGNRTDDQGESVVIRTTQQAITLLVVS